MTSLSGKQIAIINILPNISRSIGNQTMKFGQLIEYSAKSVFIQNHSRNEALRLVPDPLFFLKKTLCEVKASRQHLSFKFFDSFQLGYTIKANCLKFQTVDLKICSICFFKKGSGTNFSITFWAVFFSRKVFLMSYYINLPIFFF